MCVFPGLQQRELIKLSHVVGLWAGLRPACNERLCIHCSVTWQLFSVPPKWFHISPAGFLLSWSVQMNLLQADLWPKLTQKPWNQDQLMVETRCDKSDCKHWMWAGFIYNLTFKLARGHQPWMLNKNCVCVRVCARVCACICVSVCSFHSDQTCYVDMSKLQSCFLSVWKVFLTECLRCHLRLHQQEELCS